MVRVGSKEASEGLIPEALSNGRIPEAEARTTFGHAPWVSSPCGDGFSPCLRPGAPIFAGEQPDHVRGLPADMAADHEIDQARALAFLVTARGMIVLGIGRPQMRPLEVVEGVAVTLSRASIIRPRPWNSGSIQ